MQIELTNIDGVTIAKLIGELDGRTAPLVQDKLIGLPQPHGRLLLDMSGVSYISSAGLRALLMLYRQIEGQDGQIALAGLQENIKDIISVTGFLDFFSAYDSLQEGTAALKNTP